MTYSRDALLRLRSVIQQKHYDTETIARLESRKRELLGSGYSQAPMLKKIDAAIDRLRSRCDAADAAWDAFLCWLVEIDDPELRSIIAKHYADGSTWAEIEKTYGFRPACAKKKVARFLARALPDKHDQTSEAARLAVGAFRRKVD